MTHFTELEYRKCPHCGSNNACDSNKGHWTGTRSCMCRWAGDGARPNFLPQTHTHMLFFQIQTQAYLFLFQGCTHCTRDTFSVTKICPNMVKLPPYSYSCWLVMSLKAVSPPVLGAPHSSNPNFINNPSMAKNLLLVVCPHLAFGWTGRQDHLPFLLLLRWYKRDTRARKLTLFLYFLKIFFNIYMYRNHGRWENSAWLQELFILKYVIYTYVVVLHQIRLLSG